jgi:hypothetical protein
MSGIFLPTYMIDDFIALAQLFAGDKRIAIFNTALPEIYKDELIGIDEGSLERSFEDVGVILVNFKTYRNYISIFESCAFPIFVLNHPIPIKAGVPQELNFHLIRMRGRTFFVNPQFGVALGTYNPHKTVPSMLVRLLKAAPILLPLFSKATVAIFNPWETNLFKRISERVNAEFSIASIYTGAGGISNRKVTLQIVKSTGDTFAYIKVASNKRDEVVQLVRRESRVLRRLQDISFENAQIPKLLHFEEDGNLCWIASTSANTDVTGPRQLSESHFRFLVDLYQATRIVGRLDQMETWNEIQMRREQFSESLPSQWVELSRGAMQLVQRSIADKSLQYVMAHGDFVPWNTKLQLNGSLFIFDWEFSRSDVPPLYDFFDFIIWSGFVGYKKQPDEVLKNLREKTTRDMMKNLAAQFDWNAHRSEALYFYALDKFLLRIDDCVHSGVRPQDDFAANRWAKFLEKLAGERVL